MTIQDVKKREDIEQSQEPVNPEKLFDDVFKAIENVNLSELAKTVYRGFDYTQWPNPQ